MPAGESTSARTNGTEGAGEPMAVETLRGVMGARETRIAEESGTGEGAGETSAAEPRAAAHAENQGMLEHLGLSGMHDKYGLPGVHED